MKNGEIETKKDVGGNPPTSENMLNALQRN